MESLFFDMHALRRRSPARAGFGLLLACLLIAVAGVEAAVTGEQTQRQNIVQGITLVQNYLESETAEKIDASGTETARKLLVRARDLLEQARADLAAGNLDAAQSGIDRSIQSFSAAAVANTKPAQAGPQNLNRIRDIRAEIDAYLASFQSALAEKGPSMAGLLDQQYLQELLSRAEQSQAMEDYGSAESDLNRARQLLVSALIKIRNNETVIYTVEFQTPADEFRYERERFRDYEALVQEVLNKGSFEPSRRKLFDQLHGKGNQFSEEAMKLAGEGNYEAAIERMEEALGKMVQGLQLLGVPLSM